MKLNIAFASSLLCKVAPVDRKPFVATNSAEHRLHTERLSVADGLGSEARRPVNVVVRFFRGTTEQEEQANVFS